MVTTMSPCCKTALFFVSLMIVIAVATAKFTVRNGHFYDDSGRERIFHGVNVVYKSAPYIPIVDHFDGKLSFAEEDAALLQSLGLNVIRLGAQWSGIEPVRGQYNATYISLLHQIVQICAAHNITVFLDAHQDCFSERFCGEGVPTWAVNFTSTELFPLPLDKPYALTELNIPSVDDCNKHGWGDYQLTEPGSEAYERLYVNEDGLADSFGALWGMLGREFKGVSNILAFELINEPFAGNIYKDPALLFPGHADKVRLEPFYDHMIGALHEADPDRLVMFEPCTWSDAYGLKIFDSGFTHAPGGAQYANTSVFAYHYYDYVNKGPAEDYFKSRTADATRLAGAAFLTETEGGLIEVSEQYISSWTVWEYKSFLPQPDQTPLVPVCTGCGSDIFPNGNYSEDGARLLSRTYPHAVQGTVQKLLFNGTTNVLHLEYLADPSIPFPTEIFLNEKLRYPNGYVIRVTSDLHVEQTKPQDNWIYLVASVPPQQQVRGRHVQGALTPNGVDSGVATADTNMLVVVDITPSSE